MELGSYYHITKQKLADSGAETPDLDARSLISHHAKLDHADFITNKDQILDNETIKAIEVDIARRIAGEPVSRILGMREFWGLEFKVTPDTLDPRPDTETLIEAALKFARSHPKNLPDTGRTCAYGDFKILDLGTGTGCIPIALLSELPKARALAIDISENAIEVARANARAHGVEDRLKIVQGDWMEGLEGEYFDLIVSNPPYIPASDIENLSIDVKNHDPILSLSGGNDGLDCYKKIIFYLKKHLNTENRAFLEIGFDQLESLTRLVEESNLFLCDSHADIAGIPRVVEICRGDK